MEKKTLKLSLPSWGVSSLTPIADPDWKHEQTLPSHYQIRILIAPFSIRLPGVRLKADIVRAEKDVGTLHGCILTPAPQLYGRLPKSRCCSILRASRSTLAWQLHLDPHQNL